MRITFDAPRSTLLETIKKLPPQTGITETLPPELFDTPLTKQDVGKLFFMSETGNKLTLRPPTRHGCSLVRIGYVVSVQDSSPPDYRVLIQLGEEYII